MKLSGKRKGMVKIAVATMVAVFSLASMFAGTYAWFTMSSGVDVTGSQVRIGNVITAVQTITVHDYYGMSSDKSTFGFNPAADHTVTINSDYSGSETTPFEMGTYTLEEQHQPVLYLFATNGNRETIKLKTSFSYLANSEPVTTVESVATFSALASSYAENTFIKVLSDENHGGTSTIYKYTTAKGFEMKWIDLQNDDGNPLSSIVQVHYFVFDYNPTDQNRLSSGSLTHGNITSTYDYMPYSVSQCASTYTTNMSSFITFNNGSPVFNQEITVYSGETYENGYVGVIFDYYPESIEYLYSYYLGHDYVSNGLSYSCDWNMEI